MAVDQLVALHTAVGMQQKHVDCAEIVGFEDCPDGELIYSITVQVGNAGEATSKTARLRVEAANSRLNDRVGAHHAVSAEGQDEDGSFDVYAGGSVDSLGPLRRDGKLTNAIAVHVGHGR